MATGNKNPRTHRSFSLGGGRESLAMLILLVVFSGLAPTFRPLLVVAEAGLGIYWYVRASGYFLGRAGGWFAIATLLLAATSFGVVQYLAQQRNDKLDAKMRKYDEITIRRFDFFPTSPVFQITFENRVDDEVVDEIVRMPELANVSDVYLKAPSITDRGLNLLDQFPHLKYVYVGSTAISEQAAEDFQVKHPQCSVIVPNVR